MARNHDAHYGQYPVSHRVLDRPPQIGDKVIIAKGQNWRPGVIVDINDNLAVVRDEETLQLRMPIPLEDCQVVELRDD